MSGDSGQQSGQQRGDERRVLVPDLVGAPLATLRVLEEALLMLDAWEVDPDDPIDLPAAIAGGTGIDLIDRLRTVLVPTQRQSARTHGRLLAPFGEPRGRHTGPGHDEYVPLTEIRVSAGDIAALSAIAQALGHPALDPLIGHGINELAGTDRWPTLPTLPPLPVLPVLVEGTARLAGLLDLAWTPDAQLLAPALSRRGPGRDVVLTEIEHACYERVADRINAMAIGDTLSPWLY
jgi:hypothetical protein